MSTPSFNPAYRIARCGDSAAHGPHVVEHGPDQPRNCPGTGHAPACVAGVACEPYCDAAGHLAAGTGDAAAQHPADCPGLRIALERLAQAAGQYLDTERRDEAREAELRRRLGEAVTDASLVLYPAAGTEGS